MKNKTFAIFSIILVLLLSCSAAFATFEVDANSIDRDDAVTRSNPIPDGDDEKYDDDNEIETAKFTLTFSNVSSTTTVSEVRIAAVTDHFNSDIEDEVTSSDLIIYNSGAAISNSSTLQLEFAVPSDLDSIDRSSYEFKQHTFVATVVGADGSQSNVNLNFYVENGLEFDKAEVSANNDFECEMDEIWEESLDCDDEAEEVEPSEDFEVKFIFENKFDEKSELNFEDVEIELDTDNNDVEAEDDNYDEDIDAEEVFSLLVKYELDDVEDGDDSEIEIIATVEDENGAFHGFKHTLKLDFELPKYALDLDVAKLAESSVCAGDLVTFNFEVTNKGSKDQENIYVTVKESNLDWSKVSDKISIDGEDRGDYESEKYSFRMTVPEDAKVGSYLPRITAYYEDDDKEKYKFETLNLKVKDCTPVKESTSDSKDTESTGMVVSGSDVPTVNNDVTTPTVKDNTATATPTKTNVVTAKAKESNDTLFVVGMTVLGLVLLSVIGSMIALLVRK